MSRHRFRRAEPEHPHAQFNVDAKHGGVPNAYVEVMGKLTKDLAHTSIWMGEKYLNAGGVSVWVQLVGSPEVYIVVRHDLPGEPTVVTSMQPFPTYVALLGYLREHAVQTPPRSEPPAG
jgi:hypothetical protein